MPSKTSLHWFFFSLFSVILLLCMNAEEGIGFLPCLFRKWTGYPCFSCGMTRGVISVFQGQWLQALAFHPFSFGVALLLLFKTAEGSDFSPLLRKAWIHSFPFLLFFVVQGIFLYGFFRLLWMIWVEKNT